MNDATAVIERSPAIRARDAVTQWLSRFEAALTACDPAALGTLFVPECHYRDMLAFSWTICPVLGVSAVADFLAAAQQA